MSFNGSGTFVINSAGQPVVSGTVISSTAFNALTADLANGLSTCITKDGQTTPTADIPMGSNKITGLANGTAAGDAANLGQVQSTVAKLLGSVSGADTITAVGSPTVAAYAAGQMFYFVAAAANTGAVTINIDSLGAKSITRDGTTALAAGDIQSGEVCVIVYDGTQFQLVNGASQSASIVTENLTVNKATVLNESGGDNDTRIEGDTDANLFFVDASADSVGIGTSSPDYKFHVSDSGDTIAAVTAGASSVAGLNLGNSTNKADGGIRYDNATDALIFRASNAEKMRLDSAGNLGLGVTPSAWFSNGKALQLGAGAFVLGTTTATQVLVGANFYFDGSNNKYIANGEASYHQQTAGKHEWYTAPSGTAGNTITFTQAMTLDASGNLGLGTTSPGNRLHVTAVNGDIARFAGANENFYINTDSQGSSVGNGASQAGEWIYFNAVSDYMAFATSSTERARITSGGDLLVGTTSTTPNPGVAIFASGAIGQGNSAGASGFEFHSFRRSAVQIGSITQNGTTAVAYNTSSDRRLKENIVPAPDAGEKIDAIEIVSHDWKSNPDEHVEFGVVAQDLALIAPQAVTAGDDGEEIEKTWGVDYSKLVPMLIKEVQSLRKRVAELEAK